MATYNIKKVVVFLIALAGLVLALYLFYSPGELPAGGAESNTLEEISGPAVSDPPTVTEAEENKEQE